MSRSCISSNFLKKNNLYNLYAKVLVYLQGTSFKCHGMSIYKDFVCFPLEREMHNSFSPAK